MSDFYMDTPSSKAAEKSSTCNLSIFSSRANSEGGEVIRLPMKMLAASIENDSKRSRYRGKKDSEKPSGQFLGLIVMNH
jgi:hypothetical protein